MLGTLVRRGATPARSERSVSFYDWLGTDYETSEARTVAGLSFPDWLRLWETFGWNGIEYVVPGGNIGEVTALQAQRNPVVWGCIGLRAAVFAEACFAFQKRSQGRWGELFGWGSPALAPLEHPWPQAQTESLLARMEVDASLYGNSYWYKMPGNQLLRLDPTRMQIATAEVLDPNLGKPIGKRLVGYTLHDRQSQMVGIFLPEEILHYRPIPDPAHEYRGISWMNALLPDIIADMDMSDFKHAFLRNSATPSLVVMFEKGVSREAASKFKDRLASQHRGPEEAWKPLYLGAAVDVKVVGSNFADLNIGEVQSQGETRIAMAASVPPSLLGLSEGLKGSALNAGNYAATRRRFSDATIRPLWRHTCSAATTVVDVPPGARLWYDDRDITFLQADITDRSQAMQQDSSTILNLVNSGYEPDSVTQYIVTGDASVLVHTGLVSVQLQTPGSAPPSTPEALPAPNNSGTDQ